MRERAWNASTPATSKDFWGNPAIVRRQVDDEELRLGMPMAKEIFILRPDFFTP